MAVPALTDTLEQSVVVVVVSVKVTVPAAAVGEIVAVKVMLVPTVVE